MSLQPTQPQSIGGVLDTSFQLYKASVGAVWPICVLLVLGSSPPSIYMLTQGVLTPDPNDPFAALAVFTKPGYLLSTLLSMVLTMWTLGAVYLKEQAIAVGEPLGIGQALGTSLGRTAVLFVMVILYILAIVIGSILLIVPGVILTVSLMLAWNLALFELKGPIGALAGSHRLVWGNWWRTTTIITVGFVIVMVLYFAIAALVGVVMALVGPGLEDPGFMGTIAGLIIGLVANLLMLPYMVALMLAVYWDLKLRKEGSDLAARVGELKPA